MCKYTQITYYEMQFRALTKGNYKTDLIFFSFSHLYNVNKGTFEKIITNVISKVLGKFIRVLWRSY